MLMDGFVLADCDMRTAFRRLERAAVALVRRHRRSVAAVADELLRLRELSGEEIQHIMASARAAVGSTGVEFVEESETGPEVRVRHPQENA